MLTAVLWCGPCAYVHNQISWAEATMDSCWASRAWHSCPTVWAQERLNSELAAYNKGSIYKALCVGLNSGPPKIHQRSFEQARGQSIFIVKLNARTTPPSNWKSPSSYQGKKRYFSFSNASLDANLMQQKTKHSAWKRINNFWTQLPSNELQYSSTSCEFLWILNKIPYEWDTKFECLMYCSPLRVLYLINNIHIFLFHLLNWQAFWCHYLDNIPWIQIIFLRWNMNSV